MLYHTNNPRKIVIFIVSVLSVLLISIVISHVLESFQRELTKVTPKVIGTQTASTNNYQKVAAVIDGDTIHLEDGSLVRYIGIDTPETVDPRKSVECFGKEASEENKLLVEGKLVRLEKDVSEVDRYQRLLRYVWVKDLSDNETFVNLYLVRNGFARASSYPPDVKYQDQFRLAERQAREENLGLWQSCP